MTTKKAQHLRYTNHIQSFHWFATNEALKEIQRVIQSEAAFGMIWNIEDCK